MSKQTITLGVLTFNEGELLRKLLTQIHSFVDEVIVVDSFSDDTTIEVCKEFNTKIIQVEFNNSFAELRNILIQYATSDYILMLDCDELLEDPEEFFNLEFTDDVYFFPRHNYVDGLLVNPPGDEDRQGRLLKNDGIIQYYRRVHELLTGYNSRGDLDTWIIHNKTAISIETSHRKYESILAQGE